MINNKTVPAFNFQPFCKEQVSLIPGNPNHNFMHAVFQRAMKLVVNLDIFHAEKWNMNHFQRFFSIIGSLVAQIEK